MNVPRRNETPRLPAGREEAKAEQRPSNLTAAPLPRQACAGISARQRSLLWAASAGLFGPEDERERVLAELGGDHAA
jgi:hypothetical protein